MEELNLAYQGEHLFIGNLGHFFVVLSFIAALVGALLYFNESTQTGLNPIKSKWSRYMFFTHGIAVVGIVITLFTIISNHYFEYHYAWQHSSLSLPVYYMISCFWEGQEGSFLLWLFWNVILGLFVVWNHKKWESSVMSVVMLAQAVLSSMLLGLEVSPELTIGSSPFNLLREAMGDSAPIFSQPTYLNNIVDGTGLNPLLQNYWMVIHPPTLFLGFASTLIPFAFAIAAIQHKQFRAWIKPALPWALFSGMILGLGIIMGGFWAYESLSFGGYWAWDPVENASLIPWLLVIAGMHVMVINKSTGKQSLLALIFPMLGFLLVLYATFLTRSGVLGDSSVHSFTDLGLSGQLIQFGAIFFWLPFFASEKKGVFKTILTAIYVLLVVMLPFKMEYAFYPLLILTIVAIVKFILNTVKILPKEEEEHYSSREFWMLIGSLILVLSALQIISSTSIPVINKLFASDIAPPVDVVDHYNKWQMPFAIIAAVLTAMIQFLRYRKSELSQWKKPVLLSIVVSVIGGVAVSIALDMVQFWLILLMVSAFYSIIGNVVFITDRLKGKLKFAGGSIAHIGFGLMLVGVLISGVKKRVISADLSGVLSERFDDETAQENVLLMKDVPVRMGNYHVTYRGDSLNEPNHYYIVEYDGVNSDEHFTLYPNAQISENAGLMANPDTRHYITYDVFTHVTSIPIPPKDDAWEHVEEHIVTFGDTIESHRGTIIFKGVEKNTDEERLKNVELLSAVVEVQSGGKSYSMRPVYALTKTSYFSIMDKNDDLGLRLNFEIRPSEEGAPKMYLETAERPINQKYIVMKAIVFPFINLLWGGTIIMIIGFTVSMLHRRNKSSSK